MPTKNKGGQASSVNSSESNKENVKVDALTPSSDDPLGQVLSAVDKKTRNLEKRKGRLTSLQETKSSGKELDKDQLEAISKLPSVMIQIETLRDLSSTFQELQVSYTKEQKKQQKTEERQRKEAEKESQKSLLRYTLRVQGILNLIDDAAKGALKEGSDGAVALSESELKQLDEFYDLVNPSRPGNESYSRKLNQAAEHLILLFEKSNKEIVNTTYKDEGLYKLMEKLDTCGYFDKVIQEEEQEEEEIQQETPASQMMRAESPEPIPSSTVPLQITTQPNPVVPVEPFVPVVPMTTEGYHPSAPAPDFSGLQTGTLSPLGELTFMRESPTHPLIEQEPTQFTGGNFGNFESGNPVVVPSNNTNTSSLFPPPPTQPTATSNEPTPVGVLEGGTLLIEDNQYVPETGQQQQEQQNSAGGNKESYNSKVGSSATNNRSSDYNNRGGYPSHRGNGKPWRGGSGGGYRSNNRDMYNNGGNNYGRGGYQGGRGGGPSNNYRGSSRGRPNYPYNNNGRPQRGGGASGGNYRQQYVRPTQ